MIKIITVISCLALLTVGCESNVTTAEIKWDTLRVTASAYNSLPSQTTKENSAIAAWGDELKPGMKVIAVSRDLLEKGLEYNAEVRIEGLQDTFLVKDKMNRRWTNKIDIYMGEDVEKARNWGKREVVIYVAKKQEED